MMKYISTRAQSTPKTFDEVVLTGLAPDGGLYVPQEIPHFSLREISSWHSYPYQELAQQIITPFVGDSIPSGDLALLINDAYSRFRNESVAPLVQTGPNEWVLELWHGPTLAFKDFALQFLGNLLDYILEKRKQKVVILGATSGDTGSAAIEGCRSCSNVDMFILHPHQRISEVQRRQMTTVNAINVNNIALLGSFDDCQNLVKACFSDQSFLPQNRQLVAVNSINWARIVAQVVYYFWAALRLGGGTKQISFSVPTGNFGDIYAGYIAHKMGLPINQLIIATNSNDILHRCVSANDHSLKPLKQTLAPSMDIMISSNFERLLFDLYDQDGMAIARMMSDAKNGKMSLNNSVMVELRKLFSSYRCDDNTLLSVIHSVYQESGYLIDPHTAIGLDAARKCRVCVDTPMVALATAHPAKFPEAITRAGFDADPKLPEHMSDLFELKERYTVLGNDRADIENFIAEAIKR